MQVRQRGTGDVQISLYSMLKRLHPLPRWKGVLMQPLRSAWKISGAFPISKKIRVVQYSGGALLPLRSGYCTLVTWCESLWGGPKDGGRLGNLIHLFCVADCTEATRDIQNVRRGRLRVADIGHLEGTLLHVNMGHSLTAGTRVSRRM